MYHSVVFVDVAKQGDDEYSLFIILAQMMLS